MWETDDDATQLEMLWDGVTLNISLICKNSFEQICLIFHLWNCTTNMADDSFGLTKKKIEVEWTVQIGRTQKWDT